jgi:hypothetical protein
MADVAEPLTLNNGSATPSSQLQIPIHRRSKVIRANCVAFDEIKHAPNTIRSSASKRVGERRT